MPVPASEIEKTCQYIYDNQTKEVMRERDSAERKLKGELNNKDPKK